MKPNEIYYNFPVRIEDMEIISEVLNERLKMLYVGMNKKVYDKKRDRMEALRDDVDQWIKNRIGDEKEVDNE